MYLSSTTVSSYKGRTSTMLIRKLFYGGMTFLHKRSYLFCKFVMRKNEIEKSISSCTDNMHILQCDSKTKATANIILVGSREYNVMNEEWNSTAYLPFNLFIVTKKLNQICRVQNHYHLEFSVLQINRDIEFLFDAIVICFIAFREVNGSN